MARRLTIGFAGSVGCTLASVVLAACAAVAQTHVEEPPRRIIVVDDQAYAPFSFLDGQGQPRGFTIDLWQLWSEKTGVPVEFQLMAWDDALAAVRDGRADVVGGLFRTPEREAWFDFTESLFDFPTSIFFHQQIQGIKALRDLTGFTVGVIRGDSSEELLRTQYPAITLRAYEDMDEMVQSAIAGEIKVFVADTPVALHYLAKIPGGEAFRQSVKPVIENRQYAAVRKGRADVLELVCSGFDRISRDEIDQILDLWGGMPVAQRIPWKKIGFGLATMLALICGFVIWNVELRRRVRDAMHDRAESETRYRELVENANSIILRMDREGRITFFNEFAQRFFGYEAAEAVGRNVVGTIVPERDSTGNDLRAMVADIGLRPERYAVNENENIRRDGTRVWISWTNKPVYDASGEISEILCIGNDITGHKRTEEALRLSEATYREIFNSANDTIWVHDLETFEFIDVNNKVVEMFGYPVREALGLTIEQISSGVPPFVQETAAALLKRAVAGETLLFEWHTRHKDGHLFWTEVNLRRATIAGRECLLAIERDITERKRTEEERERLMTAIEQSGEVIIITDPEGTIQYVNRAFEAVTGYTRNEVIGRTPRILKSGKQDEAFYREMWSTLTRGSAFHGRIVNKRKDGTLITEDVTISPVCDATGKIVNYVGVKRDITEHLQQAAQLQQAQKMEAVGRLAGGVAHDFNNMLGVILGNTELALDQVEPGTPLFAHLAEVNRAAERSAGLTRQLLAFARRQTVEPKVLDLNETVNGMLKMLQRLIGEDIDLAWLPGKNLGWVVMDPSQVDQVLANLCVNARDAIGGTGRITIETIAASVDEAYCAEHAGAIPGEYVMLAVSDNGCGMDKETLDRLFEPFFTTKEKSEGTGLGLATVYGIVKQNSGFINVYSEPGHGTTIKVYLPQYTGQESPALTNNTGKPAAGGIETILLVEDDPGILRIAEMMLKRWGYTVLAADTPGKAIRLAQAHAGGIHLLVTDVVMPEMNGRDLGQKLLPLHPVLKCLFMSGYTADVIAHHGVLDKGVHFIQKPFTAEALAAKVREALEK